MKTITKQFFTAVTLLLTAGAIAPPTFSSAQGVWIQKANFGENV